MDDYIRAKAAPEVSDHIVENMSKIPMCQSFISVCKYVCDHGVEEQIVILYMPDFVFANKIFS